MKEIIVVGGGIVGLAFSISAARQGFVVEVFDRKPQPEIPTEISPNVLAINPSSRTFLRDEGVWNLIDEDYRKAFTNISVKDGMGAGCISFSAADIGCGELGYIVDQSALRLGLVEAATSLQNVSLNWCSTVDFKKDRAALVVAADGIHSELRKHLRLRTFGYDYKQVATVCTVRTEGAHLDCARQWFLEDGPLAILPLANPQQVAVVWSSFNSKLAMDDNAFSMELSRVTEGDLGAILSVGSRFEFPLRQQQVLQYVAEGFALLGDAAHAIHPLAGQGANLGFSDARELITVLTSARMEGRQLGDLDVLKRFERARLYENHLMALVMDGFHHLFTSPLASLVLLRNEGLRFLDRKLMLKRLAIGFASK